MPTPDELRQILQHASVRERLLIQTAAYAGLRSRELLGLSWRDVDLDRESIEVRQRVNLDMSFGPLKCPAARRRAPLAARLVGAFRGWKLHCPETAAELVFPKENGTATTLSQANRLFQRAQLKAGVTKDQATLPAPARNGSALPFIRKAAKYPFASLRYFFVAWCAIRPQDGGLGLSPLVVKRLLGLSTFEMLMHTFGHFFNDDVSPDDLAGFKASVDRHTDLF